MKLRLTLKSRNLVPFFHVSLVKIAKIKPLRNTVSLDIKEFCKLCNDLDYLIFLPSCSTI